ncbi:uncharacterized protein LOC123522825 [Mercenaria mercenaria]|uniref:uncharacterized protein LOC123522825 n=1 Tax=Mercenaria mercenaria TaxID=6596 RepID=UPI00234E55F5|nr:uncharacterized protein LOC123522825 [Mercenaria mercenaria]
MDNEMNIEDKQKTGENGKMTVDAQMSHEEHVFKKARYAWQIKGHPNIDNASLNGETSCVKVDTGSFESGTIGNHERLENEMKTDKKIQSYVSETVSSDVVRENMMVKTSAHCCENKPISLDLVIKENRKDSTKQGALQNRHFDSDECDLTGNKRKLDSEIFEADHSSSKRAKSLDNSGNNGNCIDRASVTSRSGSESLVNLQAGLASAASNPDFGRAVSSILPNFQGFDIPSFIWQKQEMGCAIVDNVFNRTLEEMGLSPDPVVNLSATTRLTIENQSIETAIRNQGLRAGNYQSEQNAILSNMEQMRRNATRDDFEHTQRQLSRIMATQPRSHSVIDNDHTVENCAMNVQISEQHHCDNDQSKPHLVSCTSSGFNGLNLNSIVVPSTAGNHGNHQNSGIMCEGKNEDAMKDRHANEEVPKSANENVDLVAMEESDSLHCKDMVEKHSENVLDLAVSTAILNQGLTFDSV